MTARKLTHSALVIGTLIMFAVALTLHSIRPNPGAAAINDQSTPPPAVSVQQAPRPTDPNDSKGWNNYLGQIVEQNMQGMTASQPYAYMVTPGLTDDARVENDRQLQSVQLTVARGVLPGNLLAFGGPDSGMTANMIVTAFKDAQPGSFRDVIVLFIGDKADEQRVAYALLPSGAIFRFAAM